MVPWFPGGHADPWNHVEAAMALALGDRMAEAERAYQWLIDLQRPDGSWHQYYLADGVEQDKLDANVIAYVAAGAWHHWLLTKDRGFVETMWPVVDKAIELRARPPDRAGRDPLGPPRRRHAVVVRPAHRLVEHLPQPALRRSRWRTSSATSGPAGSEAAARLAHVIRTEPDAFAPKHRWAMDWYYPVLGGVADRPTRAASRLATPPRRLRDRGPRAALRVRPAVGDGGRDLRVRAWPTSPSASGTPPSALFGWAQQYREPGGRYWTGTVYPEGVHFPGGEQSTYTAAVGGAGRRRPRAPARPRSCSSTTTPCSRPSTTYLIRLGRSLALAARSGFADPALSRSAAPPGGCAAAP